MYSRQIKYFESKTNQLTQEIKIPINHGHFQLENEN